MTHDVQQWTNLLGWPAPRRQEHVDPAGTPIVWFESGESCEAGLLQINLLPILCGCVFALDYQICSGFYPLDDGSIDDPAYRQAVAMWLHRDHFVTQNAAKSYAALHPECGGQTWRTLRKLGYPYQVRWVDEADGHGSHQRIKLGGVP